MEPLANKFAIKPATKGKGCAGSSCGEKKTGVNLGQGRRADLIAHASRIGSFPNRQHRNNERADTLRV